MYGDWTARARVVSAHLTAFFPSATTHNYLQSEVMVDQNMPGLLIHHSVCIGRGFARFGGRTAAMALSSKRTINMAMPMQMLYGLSPVRLVLHVLHTT